MRNLFCLCLLFFSTFLSFAQNIPRQLDKYLSKPKRGHYFNGTVLVMQKDTVVIFKSNGYRNSGTIAKNDTNTIYRIGSVTKPFTATIILRLQEANLLRIEDKLSKYVPGFPGGDIISIENLLTHSSGIKDYLDVPAVQQLPDDAPPVAIEKLIGYFKNEPPIMNPGQKFSYSNSNYILLAYIIEKITHEKYEHMVRKYIFEPLEMQHSGFDFTHLTDSNKATGHNSFKYNYTDTIIDFDSTYAPGCGSMFTTAADLYKFYKGLHGGMILKNATREAAYTPRKWKYGYGWFSYILYGKQCISHAGGAPGFYADFKFFPGDDMCIVLLSNCSTGHIDSDKIASIVFGKKLDRSGL